MKSLHKHILIACLTGFLSACSYGDINIDPNSPSSATLPSLLASSEVAIAYNVGADISQFSNIFTQHITGTVLQAAAWDRYNVDADAGTPFNSFYSGPMQDLVTLIELATGNNASGYTGIGKILMAYSLGTITAFYGDIPYSEAFKGALNPYPKFDKQEDIYNEIQNLLDEGIALLQNSDASKLPGRDDFIFRGNAAKWIATAYSLKARYYLHLAKIRSDAASKALESLYSGSVYRGIAGNDDDCQIVFGTGTTEASPWSQQISRRNDFRLGAAFISLLKAPFKDPRLPFYATLNAAGEYSGSPAGLGNAADSEIGSFFRNPANSVQLISFAETKFIESEALLRTNASIERVEESLKAAVKASVDRVTASAAPVAFVNSVATISDNPGNALRRIITQKYIALFTQPEVWTDWLRTGYPELEPSFGGVNELNPGGLIPRRLPVPLNERLNNPNSPAGKPSLQNPRFFWDQ